MKKLLQHIFIASLFLGTSIMSVSAEAVDCSDSCPSGTSKSKISGTDLCECIQNSNNTNNNQGSDTDFFEVTDERLDSLDPLRVSGSDQAEQLSTPGGIVSRLLEFIFPLAGIALFVMFIAGGLQIMLGQGEQKAMEAGRQRITMAVIGFMLLFASYWIAQILEQIFKIQIL